MSQSLTLTRILYGSLGTFGAISWNDLPLCVTCELPWRSNQDRISCVPEGTYQLTAHSGTKFKDVWKLQDVPERDDVLLHWGNTVNDILGCILVGQSYAQFGALPGVANSVSTIQMLRKTIKLPTQLIITSRFPVLGKLA